MKYMKKLPETDRERSAKLCSEGWKRLKEPSGMFSALLWSLPFLLLNAGIYLWMLYDMYLPFRDFLSAAQTGFSFSVSLPDLLFGFAALFLFVLFHEGLHACLIPNVLKSDRVFWGLNGFGAFVYTTLPIPRNRFLLITALPFVALSFALPAALNAAGLLHGFTAFLCLVNAMGSCVDCLNFFLVFFQAPRNSTVLMNGMETYYL